MSDEKIPQQFMDLLTERVFAKLGTIMPDGRPQVHQMWADYKDGKVRINTAIGRQKDENLVERTYATLLFVDPDNPYRYIEIRGHVAERIVGEEAERHIDTLSEKYTGNPKYPWRSDSERRVMYLIDPDEVYAYGS
ncbi:MAG: PPOX class F420-dependent oxidoreductase [Candidatus Promineifilaceae bacterium]|nr:PPOX class F420-dependent oxidoreductase [Candidatus Promineifilaceae bacterium]